MPVTSVSGPAKPEHAYPHGKPSANLLDRFSHHPPKTKGVIRAHEITREMFINLAGFVEQNLKDGREKSIVLTKLHEALMMSNASIALNQTEFDKLKSS